MIEHYGPRVQAQLVSTGLGEVGRAGKSAALAPPPGARISGELRVKGKVVFKSKSITWSFVS